MWIVSSDLRTFTTPWFLFDAVAQVTELDVHRDVSGVVRSTRLCELWKKQYALMSWPNGRIYRDQFGDVVEGPSDCPGFFQMVSFPRVSQAKLTYWFYYSFLLALALQSNLNLDHFCCCLPLVPIPRISPPISNTQCLQLAILCTNNLLIVSWYGKVTFYMCWI